MTCSNWTVPPVTKTGIPAARKARLLSMTAWIIADEAFPLSSAITSWTAPAGSAFPGLTISKAVATLTPSTVVAPYWIAARMPRRSVRKKVRARPRRLASLSWSVPPAAAPGLLIRMEGSNG